MGQSLTNIVIHLVFSTKERRRYLDDGIREELHRYIAGILKGQDCQAIEINSVADHVHVLFEQSKNVPLVAVVKEIKAHSSSWMKTAAEGLPEFSWQKGYGAFSVSALHVEEVRRYIQSQAQHHAVVDFQTELKRICLKNGVNLDERYAWE